MNSLFQKKKSFWICCNSVTKVWNFFFQNYLKLIFAVVTHSLPLLTCWKLQTLISEIPSVFPIKTLVTELQSNGITLITEFRGGGEPLFWFFAKDGFFTIELYSGCVNNISSGIDHYLEGMIGPMIGCFLSSFKHNKLCYEILLVTELLL